MQENPYQAPQANLDGHSETTTRYAGFWIRLLASIIDVLILAAIQFPLLYAFYGSGYFTDLDADLVRGGADLVISYILPLLFSIVLWVQIGGTPGKRLLRLRVVDEKTGKNIPYGQAFIRYIGYIASSIPLLFGFIWVAFDKRKKGWHDHIAGTIIIQE